MTEKQKETLRRIIAVVYETIKDGMSLSTSGIPNGHLYTMLMSALQLSFDAYMSILSFLKRDGYITESHNVLKVTDKIFPWSSGV